MNSFLWVTDMTDQNTPIQPKFSKIDSVASQVGLGKSTVLAWESTGKFPRAVRLSHTVRVWLQQDIDNWILEQHGKSLTKKVGGEL
jgi:predicted DNA-binding transcriptional regulator AlpA